MNLANLPSLDDLCDIYIQEVLGLCGGNRLRASKVLRIGRTSLYRYMREYEEKAETNSQPTVPKPHQSPNEARRIDPIALVLPIF